jgi:hypothetical protein
MRLTRRIRCAGAALLSAALFATASAQTVEPLSVAPFAGESGYQEIPLDATSWYLAFHGTRKHSLAQVQTGWLARASQLCESVRMPFIVELRYVGDTAYEGEAVAQDAREWEMVNAAGAVYIPMFIPSGPRNIPPHLTPSKSAVVRCLDRDTGLKPGRTAISLAQAKEAARKLGL